MIEVFLLGIVLLVPLALGTVDVSNYFSALMAGESAAREAARSYSLATTSRAGAANAHLIVERILTDSGIRYVDLKMRFVCSNDPCLTAGARVRAIVDFRTELRIAAPSIHAEETQPIEPWVASR